MRGSATGRRIAPRQRLAFDTTGQGGRRVEPSLWQHHRSKGQGHASLRPVSPQPPPHPPLPPLTPGDRRPHPFLHALLPSWAYNGALGPRIAAMSAPASSLQPLPTFLPLKVTSSSPHPNQASIPVDGGKATSRPDALPVGYQLFSRDHPYKPQTDPHPHLTPPSPSPPSPSSDLNMIPLIEWYHANPDTSSYFRLAPSTSSAPAPMSDLCSPYPTLTPLNPSDSNGSIGGQLTNIDPPVR